MRISHNPMSGGRYVAMHEDITEAMRAEQQIRYLGSHDGLTGLPNRSLLLDRIGEALARARRGEMFCLHYLDLDNFKSVNDLHGHSIGDLLLKQAVARLRLCLRETDTLARLGGDEFVVLQADVGKAGAGRQPGADALSRRSPSRSISTGARPMSASASASRSARTTGTTWIPC